MHIRYNIRAGRIISQGQISPLGTDQQSRRPSRSPRNQRSRSADVDCLKKYTAGRKFEQRRHTEAGEVSRWIPLSKSSMRSTLPTKDHTLAYGRALANAKSGCGNTDPDEGREGNNNYISVTFFSYSRFFFSDRL